MLSMNFLENNHFSPKIKKRCNDFLLCRSSPSQSLVRRTEKGTRFLRRSAQKVCPFLQVCVQFEAMQKTGRNGH